MGACEITNKIDFSDFENKGLSLSDVHQHFLETGEVPSPEFLKYKVEQMELENIPVDFVEKNIDKPYSFTEKSVSTWLTKLKSALKVNAEIISKAEAREMHTQKGLSYRGQNSFFHNGVAYFIEGTLTPESLIHEFSHPFIKMISSTNPELFNSLYDEFSKTEEGKKIIKDVELMYGPEDLNKEEVLVRALTKMTLETHPDVEFKNFIDKIFFHIKQALRKIIGKGITIHTLSSSTTLKELADILGKGDLVDMNAAIYTDAEVFDYLTDYNDFINQFTEIINNDEYDTIQNLINETYNVAVAEIKTNTENPLLKNFADALVNDYDNTGLLLEIEKEMKPFSTKMDLVQAIGRKDAAGLIASQEVVAERLRSLTNNLFKIEKVLTAINENIDKVSKLQNRDDITAMLYYAKSLENWGTVIEEFYNSSLQNNTGSDLNKLATKLKSQLDGVQLKLKKARVDAVTDEMYNSLKDSSKKALDAFNKEEARLKSRNAPKLLIDKLYKEFHNMSKEEYDRYKSLKAAGVKNTSEFIELQNNWLNGLELTKEKVRMILMGEASDASWFNSMLESASLNTDAAVASVNDHIQSTVVKYEAKALTKFNEFVNAITPLIKKNGTSFQKRGSSGRKLGFQDKTGSIVDGQLVMHNDWTLLNKWKEFSYDQAKLKYDVIVAQDAFNETNSDQAKEELYAAKKVLSDWKNKYMNQNFSPEYHLADDLLNKDSIGLEASERRADIYQEMASVENNDSLNFSQKTARLNLLWDKYNDLSSLHNNKGVMKTGNDLKVAERILEYSKAKSKFITWEERPNAFQDAYNNYIAEVRGSGIPKADQDKMVDLWLKENTRVSLKNSVLNKKQELLEERTNLLQALTDANKNIYNDSEQRQLILDMVKFISDNSNQPVGTKATSDVRKKVKAAHEKIEEESKNLYNYKANGLNNKDNMQMLYLLGLKKDKTISADELVELSDLIKKQLNAPAVFKVNQGAITRLLEIDAELATMSTSEPTASFILAMQEIFANDTVLFAKIKEYLKKKGIDVTHAEDLIGEDFVKFINTKPIIKNADLLEFISENFYKKVIFSKLDNEFISINVLTNIWTHNASRNPLDYKTKMLKDENGKNLGLIKIDGVYRFPTLSYQNRQVKDEFVTKKIVGETVNNKGQWLPKKESTNKYLNTDYENLKVKEPDQFELLQEITKQFLFVQEGAEDKDKLYLSFPRTRKTRLENIQTGNIFKYQRRFREFTEGTGDDLEAIGSADEIAKEMAFGVYEAQDAKMAVKGVSRLLNNEDVSTDIFKTIPEYMASLFHKQAVREENSYARTVSDIIVNEGVSSTKSRKDAPIVNKHKMAFNLGNLWSKRDSSNRKKAIQALVERDLDGVYVTGIGSNKMVVKSFSALNKSAGFRLFSGNPLSALKNYAQMKIIAATHAFSFDQMNPIDGAVGEVWALGASIEISKRIRSRKNKGYKEQLANIFDPAGGRSMETMGDSLSRTYLGDTLELKFLQKGRKWQDLQGALQNFAGLMNNKKVTITDSSGNTKTVSYLNAFELVDGRVQSKAGLDPEYALSYDSNGEVVLGKKLIEQRLKMQQIIMTWNGAFAKKDAPLVTRNIFIKQLFFIKQHLVPISVKNYGFSIGKNYGIKKRMNWLTGEAEYGHFISTYKSLIYMLRTGFKSIPHMTRQELVSFAFVINYIVIGSIILPMLQGLISILKPGDDGDDEEDEFDYKQMKYRSGHAGTGEYGTLEDKFDFELDGYFLNQATLLLKQTKDEYESMNLFTTTGARGYINAFDPDAVAVKMYAGTALKLVQYLSGDEKDEYQRTNGPYFFQEAGYEHGKLYDVMFDLVGINGKMIDPVKALQDHTSFSKQN